MFVRRAVYDDDVLPYAIGGEVGLAIDGMTALDQAVTLEGGGEDREKHGRKYNGDGFRPAAVTFLA